MQFTPPGIPFPQEIGGAEDASSPVANAGASGQELAATSPAAMMKAIRRMYRDSNVLSLGRAQANRT